MAAFATSCQIRHVSDKTISAIAYTNLLKNEHAGAEKCWWNPNGSKELLDMVV